MPKLRFPGFRRLPAEMDGLGPSDQVCRVAGDRAEERHDQLGHDAAETLETTHLEGAQVTDGPPGAARRRHSQWAWDELNC